MRLNDAGVPEVIASTERLNIIREARETTANGVADPLTRWLFEPNEDRTLSPWNASSVNRYLDDLVSFGLQLSTQAGRAYSLNWVAHTRSFDPKALGAIAANVLRGFSSGKAAARQAEWLCRKALEKAPDDPWLWSVLAEARERLDRMDESAQALAKAVALNPDEVDYRYRFAELEVKRENWTAAIPLYTEALKLREGQLPHDELVGDELFFNLLADRETAFRETGRFQRARNDIFRAYQIPPRDPRLGRESVDLNPHFNGGFLDPRKNVYRRGLSAIPRVLGSLGWTDRGGVSFDVRGYVQLRDQNSPQDTDYPRTVDIEIERGCAARVHFLHALDRNSPSASGNEIGRYIIVYTDGATETIPLRIGREIGPWNVGPMTQSMGLTDDGMAPAWFWSACYAEPGAQFLTDVSLYKTTWQNPKRENEIRAIRFQAEDNSCGPMLFAITLE